MTTFIYHGVDMTIDVAYPYARVSTAQQTIEHGGEGIARQIDLFQIFCDQYGVTVDHNLTDLAKSGSKGKHLEEGGALAVFMELATKKKLKPNAALIVESFSRLSRLPIDLALRLFLDIIGSGCTLITLADHNAYTRATLRRNHGQIYQVSSAMQAARAEAEAKAFYATQSWQRRRGSAKSVYPAWITCEDGRLIPDPVKAAVVDRYWHMALEMGVTQICQILNSEGVPVLDGRKRKRRILVWNPGSLITHLRSRQVLGEQLVGHYVDGKRRTNGEYIQAYPPVISEELWQAVQVKLDFPSAGCRHGAQRHQLHEFVW